MLHRPRPSRGLRGLRIWLGAPLALLLTFGFVHQQVLARMLDSQDVDANTFSTANPFRGVRQVLSGTFVNNSNGTQIINLGTTVDMDTTVLYFSIRHDGTAPPDAMIRGRLATASSLNFTRSTLTTDPITVQWYLVEYFSGVSVQRGTVSQSSTTVDVTLPTALGSTNRAIAMYSKTPANSDTDWDDDDPVALSFPDAATLRIESAAANALHNIDWQVVEYTEVGLVTLRRGSTSLGVADLSQTVAIGASVSTTQSMLLISNTVSGSGTDIGARFITGSITGGGTTITVERGQLGDTDTVPLIRYTVIEFGDSTEVSAVNSSLGVGTTLGTESYTVSDDRFVVSIGTTPAGGGLNGGRAAITGTELGNMSATFMDIGSGDVEIERDPSDVGADFEGQVISFVR